MVHIDLSFNNIGIIQHGLWRNGTTDNRLVNGGGWHWANQIHYNSGPLLRALNFTKSTTYFIRLPNS